MAHRKTERNPLFAGHWFEDDIIPIGKAPAEPGLYLWKLLRWCEAQYSLGIMYETGAGAVKNKAKAVKWYRRAAEQGNVDAQYSLGDMYARGDGVPEDDAEAVKWFRLAAEQDHADAQFSLDIMRQRRG